MTTCLISGASRGIGRAIAVALSRREDINQFVLLARDNEGMEQTKARMNPGKRVEIYAIDLTDAKEVQRAVQAIGTTFGTIDYLLNVAGYAEPKSLLEATLDNRETTYRVNVHSLFIITREVIVAG
ncbi:hypothetical protein GCM10011571_19350 [Marinithermofilum abyssi]|uniref:Short chain dehydrogenase n=1 Tax=Marinithermofilum abyssi TaxID=1571185 RepID=A0A8J2YAP6_9BACL|nr:SDR family oxidoreductase [Marinithermofilum abyssi]GGE17734.1 hypothetical protein GCM10011571_19350 [Marinithermofilum abyssi]